MWKIFSYCLLLLTATVTIASGNPEILVQKGDNIIPITIQNKTKYTIESLEISLANGDAPSWFFIKEGDIPLVLKDGEYTTEIIASVVNPPESAFAEIPIILTDDLGRQWQLQLGVRLELILPIKYILKQNIPNPFNPETLIEYHLAHLELQQTTLIVYNALGQKIRTLVEALQAGGVYKVWWDGKDDFGSPVASGVYVFKVFSGDFSQTKTMVLLK